MALQLIKIADVTVATPQASIDFNSIPSGYTDLMLVVSLRDNRTSATQSTINMSINGVTTNRSYRYLEGSGSTAASGTGTDAGVGIQNGPSSTSNTFSNGTIYFPNYTSSNYKSFSADSVQETNATAAYADMYACLWSSTAAITSLSIYPPSSASYTANSTATLYGVI